MNYSHMSMESRSLSNLSSGLERNGRIYVRINIWKFQQIFGVRRKEKFFTQMTHWKKNHIYCNVTKVRFYPSKTEVNFSKSTSYFAKIKSTLVPFLQGESIIAPIFKWLLYILWINFRWKIKMNPLNEPQTIFEIMF